MFIIQVYILFQNITTQNDINIKNMKTCSLHAQQFFLMCGLFHTEYILIYLDINIYFSICTVKYEIKIYLVPTPGFLFLICFNPSGIF